MHLEPGEKILKVYYHSLFPYLVSVFELLGATLPFFFIIYLLRDIISFNQALIIYSLLMFSFSLLFIYITLIYWLDRLVITNKRVVFIDWKYLSVKIEAETELKDIQDIVSMENGVFSLLPLLDFGTIKIKSASNRTAITFPQAPDPNGIKKFLQSISIKLYPHNHDRRVNSNNPGK
jgi:hypothetical protein